MKEHYRYQKERQLAHVQNRIADVSEALAKGHKYLMEEQPAYTVYHEITEPLLFGMIMIASTLQQEVQE
jgi:hypothetical protein